MAVPMGQNKLEKASDDYTATPSEVTNYQSAVGSLIYAILGTRPDITYAVSIISRYAANPTKAH